MNATLILTVFILGIFLGIIFYGGLYFTVLIGLRANSPAGWFMISLIIRIAIAFIGFYYLAGGQWERLLACLLGFMAARVVIVKLSKLSATEEIKKMDKDRTL